MHAVITKDKTAAGPAVIAIFPITQYAAEPIVPLIDNNIKLKKFNQGFSWVLNYLSSVFLLKTDNKHYFIDNIQ